MEDKKYALSVFHFAFYICISLSERRQLNYLCRFTHLTSFCAFLTCDAMARDQERVMKFVKLGRINPYSLLIAPTKPVRPCRVTKHNRHFVFARFYCDLNLSLFA